MTLYRPGSVEPVWRLKTVELTKTVNQLTSPCLWQLLFYLVVIVGISWWMNGRNNCLTDNYVHCSLSLSLSLSAYRVSSCSVLLTTNQPSTVRTITTLSGVRSSDGWWPSCLCNGSQSMPSISFSQLLAPSKM